MNNNLKETMRELMLTPKEHFVVVHVKDILERIKSDKCD